MSYCCLGRGWIWHVYNRVQNGNGYFYIREFNKEHTCGAASKNSLCTSGLIGRLIVEEVRAKPLKHQTDVIYDFKKGYGVNTNYHKTWLGVEKAKENVFGDYKLSFEDLRWYVITVKNTNPVSYIELEVDHNSRRFFRLIVTFDACVQGFNCYRPILLLDSTVLKGRHK